MAEFVEKRCEDLIPVLEQMERIKLFDKNEIQIIAKKIRAYEYRLQRHTKRKLDYLLYIQFGMDVLELVKQRRGKFSIMHKKTDIDFALTNKMNNLYKEMLFKFQEDVRLWLEYMKFCKYVDYRSNVNKTIEKMLQVHQNLPECWLVATLWEKEENKNRHNARQFLIKGLAIHPNSSLLFCELMSLEMETVVINNIDKIRSNSFKNEEGIPKMLENALVIYQTSLNNINNIHIIIDMLDIVSNFGDFTERLQCKMINDLLEKYGNEPLTWDTMARRKLDGFFCNDEDDFPVEANNEKKETLRDRIEKCNRVFQKGVKRVNTKLMWTYYIDCLHELCDEPPLPKLKKKLLKSALAQGHREKNLSEGFYLLWIRMLNIDKINNKIKKKMIEILADATKFLPESARLWYARLKFHMQLNDDPEKIAKMFKEARQSVQENSSPLWVLRVWYEQKKSTNSPRDLDAVEQVFQAALRDHPNVAKTMKPRYLDWLQLNKGIQAVRRVYKELCKQPPSCLEFHKKMYELETQQSPVSIRDARLPLEMAVLFFGSGNVELWMDYIKFEKEEGDPIKIGTIHDRAINTLESNLINKFVEEFTHMKLKDAASAAPLPD